MDKLISNKVNKILIIVTFVFNILIFAPIEIYYTNMDEFWFSIKDILLVIIPFSIIAFTILFIIEKLLKTNNKNIFLKVMFSLTVALYIQGNFLNFGYNVKDGSEVDWNSMIIKGIINTIIWIVILIFPYILKTIKKQDSFKTYSSIISLFIILIQIITLATLTISKPTKERLTGLVNENIFNLSSKNNIVVFMSDTFEGTYMNKILETNPQYKEKLKDFTYFDNCTSVSFFTYSSMPTLLTGEKCIVGNTLKENIEYCFDNTELYNILKENNYTTEIYTQESLIPENGAIDNLKEVNSNTGYLTKIKATEKLYKYTMYKYMPHFFKSKFNVNIGELYKVKEEDNALSYKQKTYFIDDIAFNEDLLDNGITKNNNKNSFKFYHMDGMHVPYYTTQDLKYDNSKEYALKSDEEKRYNEAIASLNLLCNYIEELKKANIYDNTTIIFLADHGYKNRYYTALLVKKAGESKEFKITSAPVSLSEDLVPTILNLATNTKKYGRDFFDFEENEKRTRQVYDYTYETSVLNGNTYRIISKITMQTEDLASDQNSFYVIDEEYENEDKELNEKYEFGKKVDINEMNQINSVNLVGFALDEVNYDVLPGCNISNNASIVINAEKTDKDVCANFKIKKVFEHNQTIKFKIDGQIIYTCKAKKLFNKDISFNIPKEVWNKQDKITIEMEFPDAKLGEVYPTMMIAICLDSFCFSNVN